MTAFSGVLYEGRAATRVPVRVEVDSASVAILRDDGGERREVARRDVRVDAPIPGVARRLALPDGAVVETDDGIAVEATWPTLDRLPRFAYRLESSTAAASATIGVIALAAWLVFALLLPLAADPIARNVSPKLESALGEQAKRALDRGWLRASGLPQARREAIVEAFDDLAETADVKVELAFRSMGAPNAFALPGGPIILTDEMVAFTRDDDELMGVLAHELGHVKSRHALRMALRQSGVAILVTALAGDAVGMTVLAAILPAALLDARYSREFELEADAYAVDLLKRTRRPTQAFAGVLRRFAADARTADPRDPLTRYLSSHPALDERIRRVEAAP